MPYTAKTSLTKHGAYKIAWLLKAFPPQQILSKLWGTVPNIKIDDSQARKNLSAYGGVVPDFWNDVKALGPNAIDAAVFIAIVMSHSALIYSLQNCNRLGEAEGTIKRNDIGDSKVFTNLKRTIIELGFSTSNSFDHITFSFKKIFQIEGLAAPIRELLKTKLQAALIDTDSMWDVIHSESLGTTFCLDDDTFAEWLLEEHNVIEMPEDVAADLKFLTNDKEEEELALSFDFEPGHSPKKTGTVQVNLSSLSFSFKLEHNEIQTKLYKKLCQEYGKENVRTEYKNIDLIVRANSAYYLYEIKTAKTAKLCIRQALPQLLEYAYWDNSNESIDRLVIVASADIDKKSAKYLKVLREKHKIPIFYEKFSAE